MGYSVYWANGRWQGYGVPAYCDHKKCKNEIDRGMGYATYKYSGIPLAFFCEKHMPPYNRFLEYYDIDLNKEHPDWLRHVLTDESWKEWREEEPKLVDMYKKLLGEN